MRVEHNNSLCNFLLLVGPAGSGKTACIGIMIDAFLNSCWQFATRNASQAAYAYINHTGRYYPTTFQFLCIDVTFMKTINDEMKQLFKLEYFSNFENLNEVIDCTSNYFRSVAEAIFERCMKRRTYITPSIVKTIIRNMKSADIPTTRENIVLYLERYCLEAKKSYSCIPPEIRYDIFGFDEAGRTHMIFFLLNYSLFVYVNEIYGMPTCKPTYIYVGSHTQGNVIWDGEEDFWMEKYSLITMFTLKWLKNENLLIKSNMYNRRSPTRNEYTTARNLLIKQGEDGLHIDVEDITKLQKIHDRVFNQKFTPFDDGVLIFTSTHAMASSMTIERF